MGKFLPYEARVGLPTQHIFEHPIYENGKKTNRYHLLMGYWGLPTSKKDVKGADPYELAYKFWLRVDEIRELCGCLKLTSVTFYPYLRQNPNKNFQHAHSRGDLRRICNAMKPDYTYNPHDFDREGSTIPYQSAHFPVSPLQDLCSYAEALGVFVSAYTEEDEDLNVSFWKGTQNMTVFARPDGSADMWRSGVGLRTYANFQELFRAGVAELRAF